MSFGLKIYNAQGGVELDTDNRLVRFVASYTITLGSNSTSTTVSVTGMSNDTTWAAWSYSTNTDPTPEPQNNVFGQEYGLSPSVTINSGSFTVTGQASSVIVVSIMRV